VAVFTIFTISINTIPTFARSLEGIPGLGNLVKVLQFNKGTATGGEITDGVDANSITLNQNGNTETIVINFTNNNEFTDTAANFKVDYKNNPSTMTFTINGARALSVNLCCLILLIFTLLLTV
jgi:hypothetical protein